MIFRRQNNTPAPRRTALTRTLLGRLTRLALIGVLGFGIAPLLPALAQDHGSRGGEVRQIDLGRYVLTSMDGGRWLVTDRQTGDTRVVREQLANTPGYGNHEQPRFNDHSRLGRVWRENESGWNGVWKRRGDSSIFDAEWTGPGRVTGTLDIQFDGPDRVTIDRLRSSNGDSCRYTGQISGGTRVSGTYRCGNSGLMPWSATIER